MQMKTTTAIFVCVFLAACSINSGIRGTDVGRQMANTNAITPQLVLRDAVFLLVREQDSLQAVKILEEDGAICNGSVCSWSFIHRETIFDTLGVRTAGSRRIFKRTWMVTFLGARISSKSDIVTNLEVELVR